MRGFRTASTSFSTIWAGVALSGPVEGSAYADWRWIVDVNLWGVVHGSMAFLPAMRSPPVKPAATA